MPTMHEKTSEAPTDNSIIRCDGFRVIRHSRSRAVRVNSSVFPSLSDMVDKKKKDEPQTSNAPVKVIVIEDVSASVFQRKYLMRGEERTFYSVSFSRSYRDSRGEWKYIKSFNLEDLGKVISVAQQGDEFIRQQVS